MKPDFEKIAREALKSFIIVDDGSPFGTTLSKNNPKWIENKIRKVSNELESAYLEGRKAQVKVDAEIARNYQSRNYMFMFNGKLTCGSSSHDDRWCSHCSSKEDGADQVAKAIESQELL